MSAYLELGKEVMRLGSDIWEMYKQLKPANEALAGVDKSMDMAFAALHGTLQANDDHLEKIRAYVDNLHQALVELAKCDENYWIYRSGINLSKRSTLSEAKENLVSWRSQAEGMSAAIDALLPIARATANGSQTYPGQVIDLLHSGPTSLVGLDEIALNEIVTNLSASQYELGKIAAKLSNCLKIFK